MYGKQTETAIAAMSRLAEVWDGGKTRLSAVEVADARGLPRAMVGKLLATLSQARLVIGAPGPGGGYALRRRCLRRRGSLRDSRSTRGDAGLRAKAPHGNNLRNLPCRGARRGTSASGEGRACSCCAGEFSRDENSQGVVSCEETHCAA